MRRRIDGTTSFPKFETGIPDCGVVWGSEKGLAASSVWGFARLLELMEEPMCLVGVGNPLQGDDGFGVELAESLRRLWSGSPHAVLVAGDVPESYVVPVADGPWRRVLLLDAVEAPLPAGTVIVGPAQEILADRGSPSTHNQSLMLCCEFWVRAGKDVGLLGVVPACLTMGRPLSEPVRASLEQLLAWLAPRVASEEVGAYVI